jgi:hypothetical protein
MKTSLSRVFAKSVVTSRWIVDLVPPHRNDMLAPPSRSAPTISVRADRGMAGQIALAVGIGSPIKTALHVGSGSPVRAALPVGSRSPWIAIGYERPISMEVVAL